MQLLCIHRTSLHLAIVYLILLLGQYFEEMFAVKLTGVASDAPFQTSTVKITAQLGVSEYVGKAKSNYGKLPSGCYG